MGCTAVVSNVLAALHAGPEAAGLLFTYSFSALPDPSRAPDCEDRIEKKEKREWQRGEKKERKREQQRGEHRASLAFLILQGHQTVQAEYGGNKEREARMQRGHN